MVIALPRAAFTDTRPKQLLGMDGASVGKSLHIFWAHGSTRAWLHYIITGHTREPLPGRSHRFISSTKARGPATLLSLSLPSSSAAAPLYLFFLASTSALCACSIKGVEPSVAAKDKTMSTIAMRVDLDCEKCHKKIRKVLCKIQDKVSIRTITYDDKSKTVAISGPFDAEEVADRLTSAAGKVITDMHVAGGGGGQKHAFNAPAKAGKADGRGLFGFGGGGHKHQDKGHGGGGGHKHQDKGHGGGGGNKQEIKVHGGGKQQETKGHHGGGKQDKKHVKFDFDDMSDDDDFDDDLPPHGHGHHGGGKPKIVTTTSAPVAARLDAPRTGPSMSMAAPMRMPAGPAGMMMAPQHQQPHNGMATPSIWPAPLAAPEWGYSAPSQYGGYPAGGGYYGGGVPAAAAYGGYGAPANGYGRSPYGAPPQYYEEEPSAGCSVM